jgi:excisionase family DNA binding protein
VARTHTGDFHTRILTLDPDLITLGIGRSKLFQLLQAGALESVHIGACRRIPAEALKSLVASLRNSEADATAN